jgi:cell wall-associated NlpC family hydrolase
VTAKLSRLAVAILLINFFTSLATGRDTTQVDYEAREREARKALALQIEPSGKADVKKIADYAQQFALFTQLDRTLFYFNIKAATEDKHVVLTGRVSYQEFKESFIDVLNNLGIKDIEDRIEVLPSKRLGDKTFGVVKAISALTWAEPNEKSMPTTQCIYGDVILLLDRDEQGFYLSLSAGGYIGFIKEDAVTAMTKSEAQRFIWGKRAVFQKDSGSTETLYIPMGAKLRLVSAKGDRCAVLLPNGSQGEVPRSFVSIKDPAKSADFAERVLERARRFLGSPYVFGGTVTQGADCSGFVQTVFRTVGIYLPRDAKQQALLGEISGTRWYRDDIAPGDLLFFTNASCRIIHVGIYIGNGRFIHCSPPKCVIESLHKGDPGYSETWDRAFAFAKHIIDFE